MKIAVITSCFNTQKYIHDCLTSVTKSVNFGDFEYEHVVVDDGSSDSSWKIIDEFSSPNLKKYRFEKNRGHSVAQNYGVTKTNADYLFFLDADDVLFQNSLRTLALYLDKTPSDWVYFDFLSSDAKLSYLLGSDYYGWPFKSSKEVLQAMYKGEHFFQGNCLVSRSSFEKVGRYDPSLRRAIDFDLYTRYLLANFFPSYIPAPLYLHRFHEANMSNVHKKDPQLHQKDIKRFFRKYIAKLEIGQGF